MELTPILVVGIIFGSIVTVIYLLIRKQERMAMMQHGIDINEFIANQKKSYAPIRYGLLLIGLGSGILIANNLTKSMNDEVAYFSMIFLFGGIALVASYILEMIERKRR